VFRVSGFRFWVSGFEFQVSGFRFQVSGFGFRVSRFEFRVPGQTPAQRQCRAKAKPLAPFLNPKNPAPTGYGS